ncbi:MAG: Tungsten-containing aldehyde ferredoxin oxidoreductase [Candidatus Bathyarchaeota archaeon BA1]|nr:MAG: Tungsten-containing aldehyde ferredoxin oxidoreductase [Candidatus Bathyarchaeota archaeon BA1]
MRGYAGKFLEVDLSTENMKHITYDECILKQYIGGRGLAARILWDRLGDRWETVDPLDPENTLLVLTGPLTGFFPGSKICISGKSPQSNGIVGSTVAGEFPVELKCAGYDGLIVTEKAEKPVYLFITDSKAEIKDARHLWGKGGKETLRMLIKEGREELEKRAPQYGEWKEPAAIYIGPAGENKVRVAAVNAKWTHGAGYGGYGAVMGSKNLKAIVAKGTDPLPKVTDLERAITLIDKISEENMKNTVITRRWGTGSFGYDVGARLSSEPVRNWQEEWHDERSFGVDKFEERVWIKRYWSDFGCSLACLKIATPKTGPFKGAVTDNPDYENQAYVGTNLGIFSPEENVYLMTLMDELGLCGIQCGNVLGFVGELYQRGILTKEELGGIELKWGDVGAFAALIKKIAAREGIGSILAEGTYRAALKISELKGVNVVKYAVVEKGMAIGAHGIRSGKDYPARISYACSVQAGDHTSIAHPILTHENSELRLILHDSGVYCWFNTFDVPEGLIWGLFEAVTGWKVGPEEWYKTTARRILHIQRATLLIGGPDLRWDPRVHDDNPPRFYEPLPSGPYAGRTVDKAKFEKAKKEYYENVGWDENGISKSEELKRLGLSEVDRKLEELRS